MPFIHRAQVTLFMRPALILDIQTLKSQRCLCPSYLSLSIFLCSSEIFRSVLKTSSDKLYGIMVGLNQDLLPYQALCLIWPSLSFFGSFFLLGIEPRLSPCSSPGPSSVFSNCDSSNVGKSLSCNYHLPILKWVNN